MEVRKGEYFYTIYENTLIIKMKGYLQYKVGFSFDKFVEKLFENPNEYNEIVVDLTKADYIDSTNIGLIARIIKKSKKIFDKKITIISVNEIVTESLFSVGIDNVSIFLDKNYFSSNSDMDFKEIDEYKKGDSKVEKSLAQLLYDAHSDLIDINGENYLKFKDLLNLLEPELQN